MGSGTVFSEFKAVRFYAVASAILIVLGSIFMYYSIASPQSEDDTSASDSTPISFGSPQWSGFVAMSNLLLRQPVVTSVSGSWTVPAVNASGGDAYSAAWVGIGGYGENSLIQTGTLQGYRNGVVTYYAWYELLPNTAVRIRTINVQPGDIITASVSLADANQNLWLIELNDITSGETFNKTVRYSSSRLSAEWVVERPTVAGKITDLADFGSVTFRNCTATIDNINGTVSNFPGYQLVMYKEQAQLVSVSVLSGHGSRFTVSYPS